MKFTTQTLLITLIFVAVNLSPATVKAKEAVASKVLGKLTPDASLLNLNKEIYSDSTSFYLTYSSALYYYKSTKNSKADEVEQYDLQGYFQPSTIPGSFYNSMASVTRSYLSNTSFASEKFEIVTQNGKIFVQPSWKRDGTVNTTWYEIPEEKYKEFSESISSGKEMGLGLVMSGLKRKGIQYNEMSAAFEGGNLLRISEATSSDLQIPGTYQEHYLFDQTLVPDYFKKLSNDVAESVLVKIKGTRESMRKKDSLQYFADYSYYSVWADKKTNNVVGIVLVYKFKDSKNKNGYYLYKTKLEIHKPASTKKIVVPSGAKSFSEMQKSYNTILFSDIAESSVIDAQKENVTNAKTDEDKALQNFVLAKMYLMLESYPEASEYFRKSASYHKKESVDYYRALAHAELAIGNAMGAKEYFELGFKKDSSDFLLLQDFSSFLTGLTPKSSLFQDVPRALELSTTWSEEIPDDANLITQYVSYIMLGMDREASTLKSQFKKFGTPENYNVIARAYHRAGNEKKRSEFQKLAKKAGYITTKEDAAFFKLKFEPIKTDAFDENYLEIRRYENQLKTEKNSEEKAEINYNLAIEYESLGNLSKAADHYEAAANLYPQASADRYEATAEAFWARGNGTKAKENFELAFKVAPNDYYVLTNYGMFLLGLSPTSASFRNPERVITLNKTLLNKPDDAVILNQYLALILLGRATEAEIFIQKFDDFEFGSNYMYAAFAYHVIGNTKKSKEYLSLLRKAGYELSSEEKRFLDL